jgi:hypothetical protein
MKITFDRKGHSNNSSSSHSLIFTNLPLPRDTSNGSYFGWDYFVCSDRQRKFDYLISCLKDTWMRHYHMAHIGSKFHIWGLPESNYKTSLNDALSDIDRIIYRLFISYIKNIFGEWINEFSLPPHGSDAWEYGVDHQSQLVFPVDRKKEHLDIDFIREFTKEFVDSPNLYVFGGNDNEEYERNAPTDKDINSDSDYHNVWYMLRDREIGDTIVVKDQKTGEFVLSQNGQLTKIKF